MTLISATEATNLSNKNLESFNEIKESIAKNIVDIANNGLKSTYHVFPPNTSKALIDDYVNELKAKGYTVKVNEGSSTSIEIHWD